LEFGFGGTFSGRCHVGLEIEPTVGPVTAGQNGEMIRVTGRRLLTAAEFQGLAEVPSEAEWFANIQNPRTRRAYKADIREFMAYVGILGAGEFCLVMRSHVIAWRKEMEQRGHAAATIRRKLSALASLFDHLCEANAVLFEA
jgi:hypothetical protein